MAEEEKEVSIFDLMAALPGAPNKDQIEAWKQEHGEVFCSALSAAVFRPLKRREYLELQLLAQQQQTPIDGEELLVKKCVLWASDAALKSLDTKAGSLTTLQEQILQNSNFVAPSVASALVVKL
jgi:hypothetical protein